MKSHDKDLDELLERIDMASYLDRESLDYREGNGRSGRQLNIRECPVCGSTKWKVYLSADTGQGNCFAGDHPPGKNFSKYWFIRAHKGDASPAQLMDHISQVAAEMGWRPKRKSAKIEVRNDGWELPKSIPLPHNGRTLPYLQNRGFDAAMAEYFHARYAPDGSFYRYRIDGDWAFQDYSRRIILPVFDLDGKMVTFQGRDTTGTAEKKYLFPNGLEGTGVHLYNGFNVRDTKRILVGEGAFDIWAQKKAMDSDPDLRDVIPVGTFGKHLSHGGVNDQLSKFKALYDRGVREVTLMWDGEIQATDDAIAAGRLLRQIGFTTRLAMLPDGKDPNEVPASEVISAFYRAEVLDTVSELRIRMLRRNMCKTK